MKAMKTTFSFPNVHLTGPKVGQRISETRLGTGSLYELQGDHRGDRIELTSGMIWVTQPGDPEDHLLEHGDTLLITRPGRIIAQGLAESTLMVVEKP